jgi:hypothetical protein
MEFKTGNYNTRLILNPTDLILRLEHNENHRVYERTFFERDFADFIVLGGIEFVGKVLSAGLANPTPTLTETTAELNLTIPFTHALLPKPLTLQFKIPSIRREKAGADVEDMSIRLKKMEEAIVLCRTLSIRIEELESRCGDTITLPGCDYAIPTNVTHLILIHDNGTLQDGRTFSSSYPNKFHKWENGWGNGIAASDPSSHPQHGRNHPMNWQLLAAHEKSYTFTTLSSLKNLRYLKQLQQLTICGASDLKNYELGELKSLTHLNIIAVMCNRMTHTPPQPQQWEFVPQRNDPILTDISWITNMKHLQIISFRGCRHLVNVGPIKDLPALRELDLRDTGVKNTGFLASASLKITV